jgi:hypothetical protein
MNSIDALREFADRWGLHYNEEGGKLDDERKECLSDLTALISEHYYPKEFVEWKDVNCTYLRGSNNYVINKCPKTVYGDYVPYTLDELFNYWKENEQ